MSAADDMIEDRLARDLAIGDAVHAAFVRRLALDVAYYERFEVDPPWGWARAAETAREPWVRPGARGEATPARVLSTIIDNIEETP